MRQGDLHTVGQRDLLAPNEAVQLVVLLLLIQEVPVSNLGT
jgi:hypothetical protein